MKPKALVSWSSGKDSAFALHKVRASGDFEIVGVINDNHLCLSSRAKYDAHEDPEQEFPARVFASHDEAMITFVHKDQTVFVHLELAA